MPVWIPSLIWGAVGVVMVLVVVLSRTHIHNWESHRGGCPFWTSDGWRAFWQAFPFHFMIFGTCMDEVLWVLILGKRWKQESLSISYLNANVKMCLLRWKVCGCTSGKKKPINEHSRKPWPVEMELILKTREADWLMVLKLINASKYIP